MDKNTDTKKEELLDPKEDIKKELEDCKKKCEEYLNNWKRSAADFINYKKEEMERIMILGDYAKESMFLKILPIFDSFYLAEKEISEELKNSEWFKGFTQIQSQISEFLKKEGIEEIKVVGDPLTGSGQVKFDPSIMEIVEEVSEGPTSTESGMVVEELQKGYRRGDLSAGEAGKVLRPAKVKINK